MTDLTTLDATRSAIRRAKVVYIQARFGVAEHWLKITKAEANLLLDTFGADTTAEQAEMYTGVFGTLDAHGVLHLG